MKTRKYYFALLLLTLCSCSKSGDKSDLLISSVWKKSTTDRSPERNPSGKVLYQAVPACELDNTYFFSSFNMHTDYGDVKCTPGETVSDVPFSRDSARQEITINGTTYTYLGIYNGQLKYYSALPEATGYNYLMMMLEQVN